MRASTASTIEPVIVVAGALYTPEETAAFMKLKVDTLTVWRATGKYPALRHRYAGGAVRYAGEDILAFVNGDHQKPEAYIPKSRRPKLVPKRKAHSARRARRAS
jgi:hypothetical protein